MENEKKVSDDVEAASCLNNFFSNVLFKNFEIPNYEADDELHLNMNSHPILNAILTLSASTPQNGQIGCCRRIV